MSEVQSKDILSYSNFLPNQYDNSPILQKLLEIFLSQVQELEDANVELDTYSTDITLAYGYQLDIIGKLIGVQRKGRTDEQYRDAIYFQISINIGSGTPEDCIQYLSSVTKATDVKYWEHYPACIILETNGTNTTSAIPQALDNVSPAGVKVGGVIFSETGQVFRGCDYTLQDANRVIIENPFPEMEAGGVECGAAECSYLSFDGYLPVVDEDDLARCMFPDINPEGDSYFGFLGHPKADSFGNLISPTVGGIFAALSDFVVTGTTRGVFPDVYTK